MTDRFVNAYALIYAIGYVYFADPIRRWYRRHRRDADYWTHLGWLTGLIASLIMILWVEVAK